MQLIVHELSTVLDQKITTTRVCHLAHIRPHIYKHNSASGSLKVQVLDTNKKLIAESNAVAVSSVSAVAYFHGYIRFDINVSLAANTSYYIRLASTGGYSFSESNYIGWVSGHDLGKYSATYSPSSGPSAALDIEFWERRKPSKG